MYKIKTHPKVSEHGYTKILFFTELWILPAREAGQNEI